MEYRKILRGAIVLGGIALSGVAFAKPSAEMLANTCAGCHGTHGVSQGPAAPTIAGISNEYFIEAMKAYRENTRPSTIMTRIAKGYTDEEIQAMAGYFSGQKFVAMPQEADAKLAKRGAQIHERSCDKCHSEGGRASEDDAGILKGQWKPYLHWTLEDFLSGKREMPKKMATAMEKVKAEHGEEGMAALVNYYASEK